MAYERGYTQFPAEPDNIWVLSWTSKRMAVRGIQLKDRGQECSKGRFVAVTTEHHPLPHLF